MLYARGLGKCFGNDGLELLRSILSVTCLQPEGIEYKTKIPGNTARPIETCDPCIAQRLRKCYEGSKDQLLLAEAHINMYCGSKCFPDQAFRGILKICHITLAANHYSKSSIIFKAQCCSGRISIPRGSIYLSRVKQVK